MLCLSARLHGRPCPAWMDLLDAAMCEAHRFVPLTCLGGADLLAGGTAPVVDAVSVLARAGGGSSTIASRRLSLCVTSTLADCILSVQYHQGVALSTLPKIEAT